MSGRPSVCLHANLNTPFNNGVMIYLYINFLER